ncbi:nucleoid-associated protein [Pantoea agglomerans]|uniref:nucleoid-associated protein n=1 Tax=Enterobacter agglomerans TaxID=549 RepID=UPI003965B831
MFKAQFHNFIVHQITRDSAKNAFLKDRPEENKIDELTTTVAQSLLNLFNTNGLQTGSFSQTSGKPKFEQTLLAACHESDGKFIFNDFRQMTVDLARLLEGEMNKGGGKNAKPSYVVFFHHSVNNKSYLSVITLLETKGFTLEDLSFATVDRLDLDKLHLAARIRLNDWSDEVLKERYISFRVGTKSEMRGYFQDFIGCEEYVQAKVETNLLIEVIDKVCNELYPSDHERVLGIKELARVYCSKNLDEDGKVSLITLGKHLFPEDENKLLEVAQGDDFKLGERVSISKRGLSALRRLAGRTPKMSISFDEELLVERKVTFENGILSFHELPVDLRNELVKRDL